MAYPFNINKLDTEIISAIHQYEPYKTDAIIEKIIERKGLKDAESYLALAFFTWSAAGITEFDEDILQFGREALEILNPVLDKEPNHKGANSLKKEIEKAIKKSEKTQLKLEKYNKIPEDKLSLFDAEELAFFLSDNKKDPTSKQKEFRLWYRLYKEQPDEKTSDSGETYYGYNYYYLNNAANALWQAGEKEQARVLFLELLNWKTQRDIDLYDATATIIQNLLMEAVEKNDLVEFRRLIESLDKHYSSRTNKPVFYTVYADKIFDFAIKKNDTSSVKYLLEHIMHERTDRSMDEKTKKNMKAAKEMIK